jgi:metal-responsive CopG/Arc/MetJ family transcriptional regulator
MTEANFVRIELQIPKVWKDQLDQKALDFGCTTTSEAIRYLIRDFIKTPIQKA